MTNMLRAARTGGQCQQRDGNPKKAPKRNVKDKKIF